MSTRLNETISLELQIQSAVREMIAFTELSSKSSTYQDRLQGAIHHTKILLTLSLMTRAFFSEAQNTANKLLNIEQRFYDFEYVIQRSITSYTLSCRDPSLQQAIAHNKASMVNEVEILNYLSQPLSLDVENMIAALATKHVKTLALEFSLHEDIDNQIDEAFCHTLTSLWLDLGFCLSEDATCRLLEQIIHSRTGTMCLLFLNMTEHHREREAVRLYFAEIDKFYAALTASGLKRGIKFLNHITKNPDSDDKT
ncbi:hypothetical protein A0J47_016830 [Photobacterium damselae subsp. damselae]|uniref:hypothetical protein n=1 Tax=Photobacterium damselae TaxID=38293 RepID=UPI00083AC03C|nr:hypothetical protein [Photobacterium damselae]QSH59388.1 hypothetical protein A0J47_016830 [Photobacterium damselae subsp. damselae]